MLFTNLILQFYIIFQTFKILLKSAFKLYKYNSNIRYIINYNVSYIDLIILL